MSKDNRQVSTRTAALYAVGIALLVIVLSRYVSTGVGVGAGLALAVAAFKNLLDEALDRTARQQDNLFTQYECLKQLEHYVKPITPFPTTRGYRGSPDFLLELYRRVMRHQPRVIVEGSSGLSTIVCGYALQQLGAGRVISMEHEAFYAGVSQADVERHGLGHIARVHHAPIVKHTIKGHEWLWYDFEKCDLPEDIDLIVIDGPPSGLQKKARYPALPLLIGKLKVGGLLMLDDAARGGERRAVEDWKAEFPNIEVEHVPLEKGLVVVTKTRAS
jgi:predicted O-methyltransferase YrrM